MVCVWIVRNLLASGSADNTIRIWDLDTGKTVLTLRHHRSKVQSVRWHPIEPSMLASAGYDRRVCVVDVRTPQDVRSFTLPEDPEVMLWHPHMPTHLLVSTENGRVICFDASKPDDQAVMVLEAHSKAISGMDINTSIPGLLVTVSVDRSYKFWDIAASPAVLLHSEQANVCQERASKSERLLWRELV
jgi:periodic tryptophan protein 1